MLVGHRVGGDATAAVRERRAVVVGAGLAGTIAAERLAARGWEVDLVDGRNERSSAAVGLVRPVAESSRCDERAGSLARAFLYALQHYRGLDIGGYHLEWRPCGVLQVAEDEDEASRFAATRAVAGLFRFVPGVRRRGAGAIDRRARRSRARMVVPLCADGCRQSSLAVASLARAGHRVHSKRGRAVARLERRGGVWRALDANDRVIAEAPVLVIANAADARRLIPKHGCRSRRCARPGDLRSAFASAQARCDRERHGLRCRSVPTQDSSSARATTTMMRMRRCARPIIVKTSRVRIDAAGAHIGSRHRNAHGLDRLSRHKCPIGCLSTVRRPSTACIQRPASAHGACCGHPLAPSFSRACSSVNRGPSRATWSGAISPQRFLS